MQVLEFVQGFPTMLHFIKLCVKLAQELPEHRAQLSKDKSPQDSQEAPAKSVSQVVLSKTPLYTQIFAIEEEFPPEFDSQLPPLLLQSVLLASYEKQIPEL
mmetsp:Transcript_22844/g.31842  ORF Transcript_22844/g.31842 Transcript_22844/m.31842 type:complete len:101 (+) Transcript_22844:302-604(+)